jgi:DNA-directed RNA polymerase III subunit RPC3
MTRHEIDLSYLLICEHFGSIVANVAKVLMTKGLCPLGLIIKESNESIDSVRKALITLIEHQFVCYETNNRGIIEYKIGIEEVLTILRYPKYIYVSKMLFGDEAEYIVEELLRHGMLTMTHTIQTVVNRLVGALDQSMTTNLAQNVYKVFTKFVKMHFIQRAQTFSNNSSNSDQNDCHLNQTQQNSDLYLLPNINLSLIQTVVKTESESEEPLKKKLKKDNSEQNDSNIYWKINLSRFHQYLRDQTIVDAIKTHYDDNIAGEIARIILRLSEVNTHSLASMTSPLSKYDIIREAIKAKVCSDETQVEQYLHCFQEDVNFRFISKTEDRGDGMYSVNIMRTIDKLLENSLSSIVQNRYCSKSARIYRLLLEKKYLQQKQIEEYAMIPAKEAKQLTYNLYVDNMLRVLQCPKTSDYAPSRTYFLFSIDKTEVSCDVLQRCYKSVFNAITRRLKEVQQHKVLLERKNFIDALISRLQHQQSFQDVEQQIQDLRDSFTTHDSELLEKVNNNVKKLEQSELQIDDTIFLFQTWLLMNQINTKDSQQTNAKRKPKS